MYNISMSINSF